MSIKPFTSNQQEYIKRGEMLTLQLQEKIRQALGKTDDEIIPKRHHYIASSPGAGKTFTVEKTAAQEGVELIKIHGVASMNAITIQLACAAYLKPFEQLKIWIDDCDSIFVNKESLSVMKGVLDEDRNVLAWNKNLTSQIQIYENSDSAADQLKAKALRSFQPVGQVGVEIPTHNMTFIITSNHFLTSPNSPLNTQRKMDEAAIRDRVAYKDYKLSKEHNWGWTAATVMSGNIYGLSKEKKHLLLDWMYSNWDRLSATSLRSVRERAAEMINNPTNYPDYWEASLESE